MVRRLIHNPSCPTGGHSLEWFLSEFLGRVVDANHGPPTHVVVHSTVRGLHLQLLQICIKVCFRIRGPDVRPGDPSRVVVLTIDRGVIRRSVTNRPPNLSHQTTNPSEDHEDLHDLWSSTRAVESVVDKTPRTSSYCPRTTTGPTVQVLSNQITHRLVPNHQFNIISGESSFLED
uniref:Uncharacterized protein n=1 Tax=Solanum tuberosum TaxID=4113 RepID=M1DVY3_SOLTU